MAATALIKFTQGANTDSPGVAVKGVYNDFSAVTVSNGNNTDVAAWKIYLLDAPPDSATYPIGTLPIILAQGTNNTPTANFTPDVAHSYRVMLEVQDGLGVKDRDIRCFGIPDAHGNIRPPYQKSPDPLPALLPIIITELPRPIKPDEQNYSSQPRGWAGNRADGQLEQFFDRYADLPPRIVTTTPFTALARQQPFYVVDLNTIGGPAIFNLPNIPRNGQVVHISALGTYDVTRKLTVQAQGGGTIMGLSSVQLVGRSGGTFVHRSANNWDMIGGSHDTYERSLVGGTQSTDLLTWTTLGAVSINPNDFLNLSSPAIWRVLAQTTDIADPVEVRLFNVTTAAEVASSVLSFNTAIPTQQQANVVLAGGNNIYEAQARLTVLGSPNRAICYQAQLILTTFQP